MDHQQEAESIWNTFPLKNMVHYHIMHTVFDFILLWYRSLDIKHSIQEHHWYKFNIDIILHDANDRTWYGSTETAENLYKW